jgi:hypothetical protein
MIMQTAVASVNLRRADPQQMATRRIIRIVQPWVGRVGLTVEFAEFRLVSNCSGRLLQHHEERFFLIGTAMAD